MRIEKINENKIKVTISLNDLQERNIDLHSINYNSPATQELFWDMMEQAEIQFGFNATDSQLAIETVPDETEGFVVIITKLDEEGDFESIQKYIKNRFKKTDLKIKKKSQKICSSIVIYSFSNFDDLCLLSSRIRHIYTGESTLYRLKDIYYLILSKTACTINNIKSFESLLDEYGMKIKNTSFYEGYLEEYATKIIDSNAVDIINSYF